MYKPMLNPTTKILSIKHSFALARYLATLQAINDLIIDNVPLWCLIVLSSEHDEIQASATYARLEHLRSSSESLDTNFRNGANSGSAESRLASEVSSKYDSNGNVIFEKDLPEGMTLEDDENTVTMSRVQTLRENVYAIDEGWGLFSNDSVSGNSSHAGKKNGGRTYTWNERNQLVVTVDDTRSTNYVYDYNGVRTNKYSRGTETLYFNQFYSMRFDAGVGYGNGQSVKHIYLGDTRIVTKLNSVKNASYQEEVYKQYFYHSDHLGSASLISDFEGREYQRIEYTPYGETWVEKSSNTGMEYLPYKFTGKERDEETGLYYYGARYMDPQYSRWLSTDPALGDFISGNSTSGGVYNNVNMNLYHYSNNNPINYTDPDGRDSGYVVQEDGASGMSHAGVYVQTKNGYSFFEVTGIRSDKNVGDNVNDGDLVKNSEVLSKGELSFPTVGSANSSNIDTHSGVIRRDFKDKKELGKFLESAGYDNYVSFKTTPNQDRKIYNAAQQLGKDFKDYNVLFNNCGQYAVDALSAGGMGINVPLSSIFMLSSHKMVNTVGAITLNAMPRALGLSLQVNHPFKSRRHNISYMQRSSGGGKSF